MPPSKENEKTCCQHVQTRSRSGYKRYCNHVTDVRYAVGRWPSYIRLSPGVPSYPLKKKPGAFLLSLRKRRFFFFEDASSSGVFVTAGRKRAVSNTMISYIKSTVVTCLCVCFFYMDSIHIFYQSL